jgi:hypothetical protein
MRGLSSQKQFSPAIAPPDHAEPAAVSSDLRLQLSRRVDWRFLLPEPDLGHVAYVGAANEGVESLRLFSKSLVCAQCVSGDMTKTFDVVVVSHPSDDTLRRAANLVRPAGFLYVEFYGFTRGLRHQREIRGLVDSKRWRLHHPGGSVKFIEALGFTDVQAHWHWPDFETCTKIIPLNDRTALLYVLGSQGRAAPMRLKGMLTRVLLHCGMLKLTFSCFSVLGQRVD